MKKAKYLNVLLILLTLVATSLELFAQQEEENPQETDAKIKNVFLDIGYGARGVSFGAGFRWWNFSAGFGLSGIATSIPKYGYPDPVHTGIPDPRFKNDPSIFSHESFPSTTVSIDLSYYYDYKDFSFFVTLGGFVQSDSVLAKYIGDVNSQYYNSYYPYNVENKTGLSWGFGAQYHLTDAINVALAFHNKKGIYAQIGYYWY